MTLLLALMLGCIVLAWLFVGFLFWTLARIACRPSPGPVTPQERDLIRRRLKFDEPRHRSTPPQAHVSVTSMSQPDPDEVQQIMAQLGRRDAAGRAMAERILAAAGPRRPL